jgi:hypothetical protein
VKSFKTYIIIAGLGVLASFYLNFARAPAASNDHPHLNRLLESPPASVIAAAVFSGTLYSTLPHPTKTTGSDLSKKLICARLISRGVNSGCINPIQATQVADLSFLNCAEDATSTAVWTGTARISQGNGAPVHCGTFPTVTNTTLERQFVDATGNPGQGHRTSITGTIVTIDHSATAGSLYNFDNTTILPTIGTGYGRSVMFDTNSHRTQLSVHERIAAVSKSNIALFDQTIIGTVDLRESGNNKTITSGSIVMYHNILQIIGTSTFTNLVYNDQCCLPISGVLSTQFSLGSNVNTTEPGGALVGKTESLNFTSCGLATFTDSFGEASEIEVSCL